MKKNTIWVVSALTAIEPGKLVWMDFKNLQECNSRRRLDLRLLQKERLQHYGFQFGSKEA